MVYICNLQVPGIIKFKIRALHVNCTCTSMLHVALLFNYLRGNPMLCLLSLAVYFPPRHLAAAVTVQSILYRLVSRVEARESRFTDQQKYQINSPKH